MGLAESSAEADGRPEQAAAIILSPDGLKQWFRGVNRAEADSNWPAKGSRMRWWAGGGDRWKFEAIVVENALPLYVVTEGERGHLKLSQALQMDAITVNDFSPEEFLERLLAQPTVGGG